MFIESKILVCINKVFCNFDKLMIETINCQGGGGGGGGVQSCKTLFGLIKFMTAPDFMSGNVWKVFLNTAMRC